MKILKFLRRSYLENAFSDRNPEGKLDSVVLYYKKNVGIVGVDVLLRGIDARLPGFIKIKRLFKSYYHLPEQRPFHQGYCYLLRALILAGRMREAYSLADAMYWRQWGTLIPDEILLRLRLQSGRGLDKETSLLKSPASWVGEYQASLIDKECEVTIESFGVESVGGRKLSANPVFEFICPSCDHKFKVNYAADFLKDGRMLCPECLAPLLLEKARARKSAESYFFNIFNKLPVDSQGKLSEGDIARIASLVKALKPVVWIRFGCVIGAIGHLAINPCLYLARRAKKMANDETLDILWFETPVPNTYLSRMWARVLPHTSPLAEQISRSLPADHPHNAYRDFEMPLPHFDVDALLVGKPPLLRFTEEEEKLGQAELVKMGIGPKDKFVCLHIRTDHYERIQRGGRAADHTKLRNSDPETYIPAIEYLTKQGYHILRMGAVKGLPELTTGSGRVIEYANEHRTEFMDIYLSAKCSFMFSTGSGIDLLAYIFGVPTLLVNYAELYRIPSYWDKLIVLPKKIWSIKENRVLEPGKCFDANLTLESGQIAKNGLRLVDNSPEEIRDAVIEICEAIDKDWTETDEERRLQNEYWQHASRSPFHYKINARICKICYYGH
jgi:putative glycosyltransferase (TIGR04372 family)